MTRDAVVASGHPTMGRSFRKSRRSDCDRGCAAVFGAPDDARTAVSVCSSSSRGGPAPPAAPSAAPASVPSRTTRSRIAMLTNGEANSAGPSSSVASPARPLHGRSLRHGVRFDVQTCPPPFPQQIQE